jgi:hypothetical protein
MKRPYSQTFESVPVNDIRKDIPQEQLAALGAVSLSYNYAENTLNRMLYWAIGMPMAMHRDIVTRINGVDGKIAIIKSGAVVLGMSEPMRVFIAESLGDGCFGLLKKYRDAAIHARIINRVIGIGELSESRGRHSEVVLSTAALEGLYSHLEALRRELGAILMMFLEAGTMVELADDHPDREQHEARARDCFALAREYRTRRLSLPPIPRFPNEAQLRTLENQVAPTPPERLTGLLDLGSLGPAETVHTGGKNLPSEGS